MSSLVCEVFGAGISFEKIKDFESLLQKAELEKKLIFIDFYADWCAPCKTLDKVFLEKKVSKQFNNNFINSKVDVESELGKSISKKYNIVFLPSMIIVNHYGEVLLKIENLVTGSELIKASKETIRGRINNQSSALNNSPFPSSNSNLQDMDYDPNDSEKVLYVHDQRASSGRPHIMFHEAYLHLQLMDGKHEKVVTKYLSTQNDWSTDKNIKFIFDFLNNVNSPRFEYFINNKARFVEVLGEEKVSNALQILIQQRIERGFPRPGLDEAIKIYSYLNNANAQELAYSYYLKKAKSENKPLEFLPCAAHYLDQINPYNEEIILDYVTIGLSEPDYKKSLDHYLKHLEVALMMNNQKHSIHSKLAEVYYLKNNASQAMSHVSKAIALNDGSADLDFLVDLKNKIESL